MCPASPDTPPSPRLAAVVVEGSYADQRSDLLPVDGSEFRQLCNETADEHRSDAGEPTSRERLYGSTPDHSQSGFSTVHRPASAFRAGRIVTSMSF